MLWLKVHCSIVAGHHCKGGKSSINKPVEIFGGSQSSTTITLLVTFFFFVPLLISTSSSDALIML